MSTRRDFARTASVGLGAYFASAGLARPVPPSSDSLGWVNVLDHGARGDGRTDDTAAIQAAFDSRPGGTVYFPTSAYAVSGSIRIRGGFSIIGDGANASSIVSRIDDGSPVFEIGRADLSHIIRGLRLSDFTIRGAGPGRSGSGGIRVHAVYDSLFQNVRLDTLGWGFEGHRASDVQFDNLVIRGMNARGGLSGEAFYLHGQSNVCLLNKLRAIDNDGAAVRLGAGQSLTLLSPVIESTRSTAIVVGRQQDGTYANCRGVAIVNPYFEKNKPYDMSFLRGTPPTIIQGYWGPLHRDYIAPIRYHMPVNAVGCDFPDAPGGAVHVRRNGARVLFTGCTFGGEPATFTRDEFRDTASIRLLDAEGDRFIGGRGEGR